MNSEVPINVVIPAVNATTLSDVFSCLDPNSGVAQANVGDSTKGYDFDWWSGLAVTTAPPDFKGDTVKILPEGTYTVHATDTATGCVSDPINVTINSNLVYPDPVVSLVSQQISCDPANPMGELAGAVDLGGGNITTNGFNFKWYKGLNNVVPARPGYSGGPDVDGLEVGQYRLVVANDTSGCEAIADTLIQDQTVVPALASVASTPVTVCTTMPNGTIKVTVTSNSADYNFQLYKGSTVDPDSFARTGSPAATWPTTGTLDACTARFALPTSSSIARGLVGSRRRRPTFSRFARCACTVDDEWSPTALPISRTVGG